MAVSADLRVFGPGESVSCRLRLKIDLVSTLSRLLTIQTEADRIKLDVGDHVDHALGNFRSTRSANGPAWV